MHPPHVPRACHFQVDGPLLEKEAQEELLEELVHDVLEPGQLIMVLKHKKEKEIVITNSWICVVFG